MKSLRSRLLSTLGLVMFSTSLLGCAAKQLPPVAVAQPSQAIHSVGEAARRAQIQRQIAAVCPTPTQWTVAQKLLVAGAIEKHAGEAGNDLLAREWSRLDAGSKLCRGAEV